MGWGNTNTASGGGGGGSGDVVAASQNTFTNKNIFPNNGTSQNGSIVMDLRNHSDLSGVSVWPIQVLDNAFSGVAHPGNPRMGINGIGTIFTNTAIVMSAEFIGSIATNDWYPLAPFDKSTISSPGVIAYAGGVGAIAGFMSDINGPTIQATCSPANTNACIFLGGQRNPGSGVGSAKFAIGEDGTIYIGSSEPIYADFATDEAVAGGNTGHPRGYLDAVLWSEGSHTFALGGLGKLYGDINIQSLPTPTGLAVSVVGSTGAVTYGYRVAALGPTGTTLLCTEVQITNGLAFGSLNGSNYNRLSWTRVKGAVNYRIDRVTGGTTQGTIGVLLGTSHKIRFDDTGLAGGGETAPTLNSTGNLIISSKVQGSPFVWTCSISGYVTNVGTLTTRTDNTTGSVTTTATPTVVSNALADLFWSGGKRIGVTIGTIAASVVPFSGGTGDNLPVATTAITITTHGTFLFAGLKGRATSSQATGFRTAGSGSILGMTFSSIINNGGGSTLSGTPQIQMYSGTTAISGCVSAVGSALSGTASIGRVNNTNSASFARGLYTWSGNQTLNPVVDAVGTALGSATWDIILTVIMCYD